MKTPLLLCAALLALIPALCSGADSPRHPGSAALPPGHPSLTAPTAAPAEPLSGKVLKVMNGNGYTYVYLKKKDRKKIWVAFPLARITVGSTIDLVPGEEMRNFKSKALNRTFDKITFSLGRIAPQGVRTGTFPDVASPGNKNSATAKETMAITRAQGSNAHTVAELYAQKNSLNGRTVLVRGKVVKVVPRIMKMNWLHIQDGTGSADRKDHEIVVKTKAQPPMGSTITISGTLLKDKDYGSGYRYDVLIDNAVIIQ
jgi:hypothetical protein